MKLIDRCSLPRIPTDHQTLLRPEPLLELNAAKRPAAPSNVCPTGDHCQYNPRTVRNTTTNPAKDTQAVSLVYRPLSMAPCYYTTFSMKSDDPREFHTFGKNSRYAVSRLRLSRSTLRDNNCMARPVYATGNKRWTMVRFHESPVRSGAERFKKTHVRKRFFAMPARFMSTSKSVPAMSSLQEYKPL